MPTAADTAPFLAQLPSTWHLPPLIALHLCLATAALLLGPVALWARKGGRLHRAAGYAWVTCMLGTAFSSLWLRDHTLPNIAGYTPIHLFSVLTFAGIAGAIWHVANGRIAQHRRIMQRLYFGACIGAGLFALLPNRYLGHLLWHQTLGWA